MNRDPCQASCADHYSKRPIWWKGPDNPLIHSTHDNNYHLQWNIRCIIRHDDGGTGTFAVERASVVRGISGLKNKDNMVIVFTFYSKQHPCMTDTKSSSGSIINQKRRESGCGHQKSKAKINACKNLIGHSAKCNNQLLVVWCFTTDRTDGRANAISTYTSMNRSCPRLYLHLVSRSGCYWCCWPGK